MRSTVHASDLGRNFAQIRRKKKQYWCISSIGISTLLISNSLGSQMVQLVYKHESVKERGKKKKKKKKKKGPKKPETVPVLWII